MAAIDMEEVPSYEKKRESSKFMSFSHQVLKSSILSSSFYLRQFFVPLIHSPAPVLECAIGMRSSSSVVLKAHTIVPAEFLKSIMFSYFIMHQRIFNCYVEARQNVYCESVSKKAVK